MEKNQLTTNEEIVEAAASHSIRELQAMSGLSYHRIWTLLARRGVIPRKGAPVSQKLTKEVLEAIYAQGPLTLQEAADQLSASPSQVAKALRSHGMAPADERIKSVRSKFTADRAFKVLAAIKADPNAYMAEIARKFNCSREYVRQVRECAVLNGIL